MLIALYSGHKDTKVFNRGTGAVSWSVGPASGRLGVRIIVATDLCI